MSTHLATLLDLFTPQISPQIPVASHAVLFMVCQDYPQVLNLRLKPRLQHQDSVLGDAFILGHSSCCFTIYTGGFNQISR